MQNPKRSFFEYLRFKYLQFRFQRNDFMMDLSLWVNQHYTIIKKIFKWIIIISVIVFLLLLIGSSFLESVTIYYNGEPVQFP